MEESIATESADERSWGSARRQAEMVLRNVDACAYCDRRGTSQRDPDGEAWHYDHVFPRALGGGNEPSNIVKACRTCNIQKGKKIGGKWTPKAHARTAAGTVIGTETDLQIYIERILRSHDRMERDRDEMSEIALEYQTSAKDFADRLFASQHNEHLLRIQLDGATQNNEALKKHIDMLKKHTDDLKKIASYFCMMATGETLFDDPKDNDAPA